MMRSFTDGTGVCFDVKANDAEAFIENFDHPKATQDSRRVDFNVSRCKSLPTLEAEGFVAPPREDNGGSSHYSRGGGGGGGDGN